jgi:hypothetical protein
MPAIEENGAPAPDGTAAPAAIETPAPEAPEPEVRMSPAKLKARLAEEAAKATARTLKDLGAKDVEDAKARIAKATELERASLSELEKRDARIKDLEPKEQRLTVLEQRFAAMVQTQFDALPETVQAAIDKKAGGDPEKRLELIEFMRETRGDEPAAPAAAPAVAATPKPATTAPAAAAPRPTPERTMFQQYQDLEKKSSILASTFYQTHRQAIEASRPIAE